MGWTAIRKHSLAPVPWPNGRGITRDYIVRQSGAGGVALRVTLAELTEDAPFSEMPGVERVFTIASGDTVELTVDGLATRCEKFLPFRFSGGARTTCRLLDGPAEAFNLFYDPAVVRADVTLVQDGTVGSGEQFLFCPDGDGAVGGVSLGPGDLAAGRGPAPVHGTVLAVSVSAP